MNPWAIFLEGLTNPLYLEVEYNIYEIDTYKKIEYDTHKEEV